MKQLCALVRWLAWLLGATLGMTACASLPQDIPRDASYSLAGTDGTRLGQMTSKQAAAHPGLSGAYPLTRGQDAFLARLALAQAAERSLDVQYYIWRNDSTGRVLLNHLVRAAERGVRVRLLIDDWARRQTMHTCCSSTATPISKFACSIPSHHAVRDCSARSPISGA